MNIPMRRKNKERRDAQFLRHVLTRADELYVAFATQGTHGDNGAPYIIPVNFVYVEEKIYIHCALEGRKLECIRHNPYVGFSTAIDIQIIPEEATTNYKSIVGTGRACIVQDTQEKDYALHAIATRFASDCTKPSSHIARTGIIRIDIETLCGKESPPQKNIV